MGVVGCILLRAVSVLIDRDHLAPGRQTVCPIDLHSDYLATTGSVTWYTHPCMRWCCETCMKAWMVEHKNNTCRTKVRFALSATRQAK